ncbi:MAG: cyanophycinase [Chitinophagales bacterium]
MIIGGAENKGEKQEAKRNSDDNHSLEILKELLPPARAKERPIEILTSASLIPLELGKDYIRAFKKLGYANVRHMSIENKEAARDKKMLQRLENAHAVMFTGGDQFRLSTILGGTPVIDVVKQRYEHEEMFLLAGTSAGAMAMSRVMLYEGNNHEALFKDDVRTSSGFGLLNNCIVDTHFVRRGRFPRLTQAVIMNPGCVGIGLGEDTALIIRRGNEAICSGTGMVVIIDGKQINHTNIAFIDEGEAICAEQLIMHILVRGNGYKIHEREFLPSKADLRKEKAG